MRHSQKKFPQPGLPVWKRVEYLKRNQQLHLMLKTAIFLILVIFLSISLYELWRSWRRSVWNGTRTFYLVVQQGEDLWLARAEKELREITVGKIPPNLLLNLSRGYGEQLAKNVYRFGENEKMPAQDLVKESVGLSFGLPVEGVIIFNNKLEDLNLSFVLLKTFFGFGKTNLTKWDSLRLFWFVKDLRLDQAEFFLFSETPGVLRQMRPDGVEVFLLEPEILDSWIGQHFASQELINERCSWEVNNATGHSGLAGMVARILRNSGLQIATIGESGRETGGIFLDEKVDCPSVDFFSKFLEIPVRKSKLEGSRAEVTLILGNDFWQRCCEH